MDKRDKDLQLFLFDQAMNDPRTSSIRIDKHGRVHVTPNFKRIMLQLEINESIELDRCVPTDKHFRADWEKDIEKTR